MNIHEYQARELFAKFDVATQPGGVAFTPDEAEQVAAKVGGKLVVKAQIHAGGRGKGTFKNELETIKGIGSSTATQLLQTFRSVSRIKQLPLEDLEKEIGTAKAKLVWQHFHGAS